MLEFLLAAAIAFAVFLYFTVSSKHTHFRDRGAPQTKPQFFFGDFKDAVFGTKHPAVIVKGIYDAYPDLPYVGFFALNTPTVLLRDVELIKNVLMKDFASFYNNNILPDPEDHFFAANAFAAQDEMWKMSRMHMTPLLSVKSVRQLYYTKFERIGKNLVEYLNEHSNKQPTEYLDAKEITSAFTTDVVASTVYSAETNTYKSDSIFRQISRSVNIPVIIGNIGAILAMIYPIFGGLAKFRLTNATSRSLLSKVTRDAMEFRQATGNTITDVLQKLIELKQRPSDKDRVTDDYIAAQAFGFFIDLYETSSVAMNLALFEIGKNPDIQHRLIREIDDLADAHDGRFPHDELVALEYLEMVIQEVLRLHPVLMAGEKVCTKAFTFPAASPNHKPLVVEPGTVVVIPTYALHTDEKYFPDPERFNPENFTSEAIASRPKFAYLPFSDGPRICYGMRLGVAMIKFCIATILKNFEVKTDPSCYQDGYNIDPTYFLKRQHPGKVRVAFLKRN